MAQTRSGPVENLTIVTERLIEVLSKENSFLKDMQPQEIRQIQTEKAELASAYERCMQELKVDPAILANASDESKDRLRAATRAFKDVMVENERSLRAVKTVSERLLNLIVNTVTQKRTGGGYSASGAFNGHAMAPAKPVPLTVNEQL